MVIVNNDNMNNDNMNNNNKLFANRYPSGNRWNLSI